MSSRETTVLVLLDAFQWDYLDAHDTPTLWDMRRQGLYVSRILPSLGFCERTEILTGAFPCTSGNFTAIGYDPAASPYRRIRPLLKLLAPLDRLGRLRSPMRRLMTRILQQLGIRMPVFQIPLDQLHRFALTEDRRDHFGSRAFAVESLVDVMQTAGRRVYAGAFTAVGMPNGDDANRVRLALDHVRDACDLYLVYLGELDRVGHHFGPDSTQRRETSCLIDAQIHSLRTAFESHFETVHWVILGDHGMMPVERRVDAGALVHAAAQRQGLKLHSDYLIFLDSTLVRLWPQTQQASHLLAQTLTSPPLADLGELITPAQADSLHIPAPGELYGDLIWWCSPGTLVFPDYFHVARPPKGMHGYDPGLPQSQGMALVISPGMVPHQIEQGELVDICPTLCDLMGLRHPTKSQGTSFVKR
jgi:hypothetical protein